MQDAKFCTPLSQMPVAWQRTLEQNVYSHYELHLAFGLAALTDQECWIAPSTSPKRRVGSNRNSRSRYDERRAPLAQVDRAADFESVGREFESLRARQLRDSNRPRCRCTEISRGQSPHFISDLIGDIKQSARPHCADYAVIANSRQAH